MEPETLVSRTKRMPGKRSPHCEYRRYARHKRAIVVALAVLVAGVATLSMTIGSADLSVVDVVLAL